MILVNKHFVFVILGLTIKVTRISSMNVRDIFFVKHILFFLVDASLKQLIKFCSINSFNVVGFFKF